MLDVRDLRPGEKAVIETPSHATYLLQRRASGRLSLTDPRGQTMAVTLAGCGRTVGDHQIRKGETAHFRSRASGSYYLVKVATLTLPA